MKWRRSHRDPRAIEIRDDLARWRSDFDEPLPPVTRHELLNRLGLDMEEPSAMQSAPSRLSDAKAIAAA